MVLDSAATAVGGKVIGGSNLPLKKVDGGGSLYQIDLMAALSPPAG